MSRSEQRRWNGDRFPDSLYDEMRVLEDVTGPFPLLILALDRRGRVLMSNGTARDAFEYAEVDMLERSVSDLIPGLTVSLRETDRGDLVAETSQEFPS